MTGRVTNLADFVKVASVADVPDGKMRMVIAGPEQVCLANVGGKFYAIGNVCTHLHCPLARGSLEKFVVTCPCHGSQFDVRTGEVVRSPAVAAEPVYEVKIEGASIMIKPSTADSKISLPLG